MYVHAIVKTVILKYNRFIFYERQDTQPTHSVDGGYRLYKMLWYDFPIEAGSALLAIYIVYAVVRRRKPKRICLCSLFIVYLTLVVTLTLFPMPYRYCYFYYFTAEGTVILKPFTTIIYQLQNIKYAHIARQFFGNIVLGIPFGILAPPVFKIKGKIMPYLYFVAFPVLIELSQYAAGEIVGFRYRTTDIDDVILNFLGAAIGFWILKKYRRAARRVKRNTSVTNNVMKLFKL